MPLNPSPFPPSAQVDCYLRDSGGDDQELSTAQQEAVIRQWCLANGLTLLNVWTDAASPGSSTISRTAFNQMMNHFRTPGCPTVGLILWKYSRFARDIDDSQFFKADLRRRGYIIHSLMDSIPEGINGRFFEAAVDWMNQRYLEDLSIDVKRGLNHLVSQYACVPGTPPRGLKREVITLGQRRDGTPHTASRWVPDPDLWAICQKAWQLRASGASYITISKQCPVYTTKSSWQHFFKNPIYIGELHYGTLIIPNYVTPMVDRTTWDTVQALTTADLHTPNLQTTHRLHPRQASSRYILSGLLCCSRCGSPLVGNLIKSKHRPHPNYYYSCTFRHRTGQCDLPLIPQPILEALVISTLKEQILNPQFLLELQTTTLAQQAELETLLKQQRTDLKQQRTDLKRQLTTVRNRLKNITNAIADGAPIRALTQTLTDLETQETTLTANLHQLEKQFAPTQVYTLPEITKIAESFVLGLESEDQNFRRLTIHSLVEHVTLDRTEDALTGSLSYFSPLSVMSIGLSHRRDPNHTHNLTISISLPFKRKKVIVKTPLPPTSSPPATGDRPPPPDPQSPPPPSPAADPQRP